MTDLPYYSLSQPAKWPWQAQRDALPTAMPDGSPWPTISIVTPSFNQGAYLEETIRSVLLQGYPNLEYIVIDGGSTDTSLAIIRKYAPWLAYWVSEPDRGQTHAINKGLSQASGEWFNWLNSDDLLTPGALARVAQAATGADVVAGDVLNFGEGQAAEVVRQANLSALNLVGGTAGAVFHQPGLWLRRAGVVACGGINEALAYVFDYDLLIRYLALYPRIAYMPEVLARFRLHPASKTLQQAERFEIERVAVYDKLSHQLPSAELRRACRWRLGYIAWFQQVDAIARDQQHTPWQRALQLGLAMWRDPRVRVSRFTLGNIRRLLTHNSVERSNV